MDIEIDPQACCKDIENGECILLDVREPWEVEKVKLNCQHIPLATLPKHIKSLNPEKRYIVYCHHGQRSLMATLFLRNQGFNKSQSLAGGIDRWAQQIDSSLVRY